MLQLLNGPLAVRWRGVPLNHVGPAHLLRSTLTALHLRQDEGVAALAVLHTVKLLPPLTSPTSPLTVPVSGTHQANGHQQQCQMPTASGKPHGSGSKSNGHLQSREGANSVVQNLLMEEHMVGWFSLHSWIAGPEAPGLHEVPLKKLTQALSLDNTLSQTDKKAKKDFKEKRRQPVSMSPPICRLLTREKSKQKRRTFLSIPDRFVK